MLLISQKKNEYFLKLKKKALDARNSKAYFYAVQMLGGNEAPKVWELKVLFPDKNDKEIAETLAGYFNKISNEFEPLAACTPDSYEKKSPPEMFQIAARLKSFKKPTSRVRGDIPASLVNQVADILAIPLHYIYGEVYSKLQWPSLWKAETVSVIPKNAAPSEMSQLRNLSCTPLFSKVLESFILEDLKSMTKLSADQYGGIKGVGANHFLIGTWQDILENLEDQRAATSILSIDFEKAFNRMGHGECLRALTGLGSDSATTGLVHAFLEGRTMSVRVGSEYSVPRLVPGGSPQGSILGNYLFCATTNNLTQNIDYTRPAEHSFHSMDSDGDSYVMTGAGEDDGLQTEEQPQEQVQRRGLGQPHQPEQDQEGHQGR